MSASNWSTDRSAWFCKMLLAGLGSPAKSLLGGELADAPPAAPSGGEVDLGLKLYLEMSNNIQTIWL